MAAINSNHLLAQAETLVAAPAGAPRQVDLRRAISSAYYAVFHSVATALADQFIGVAKRAVSQYGLVYRSLDHRTLANLCDDLKKPIPPARLAKHVPPGGFSANLKSMFAAVKDLQEKRHSADYDPMIKFHAADAQLAIESARSAIVRFQQATEAERIAFLALLVFEPH